MEKKRVYYFKNLLTFLNNKDSLPKLSFSLIEETGLFYVNGQFFSENTLFNLNQLLENVSGELSEKDTTNEAVIKLYKLILEINLDTNNLIKLLVSEIYDLRETTNERIDETDKIVASGLSLHGSDIDKLEANVDSVMAKIDAGLILPITRDELVQLRDNNQLVRGMQYRITDYEFTTLNPKLKAKPSTFDIIVIADDDHTLNENARAVGKDIQETQEPQEPLVTRLNIIDMEGDYAGVVDENDYYEYEDTMEIDGVVYYKWRKFEQGVEVNFFILTDTRTFDGVTSESPYQPIGYGRTDADGLYPEGGSHPEKWVFPERAEAVEPQDYASWELKYTVDNVLWSATIGQWIWTDDDMEFERVGTIEIDGKTWVLWYNKDFDSLFGEGETKGYYASLGEIETEEASLSLVDIENKRIVNLDYGFAYYGYKGDLEGKGTILWLKDEYHNSAYYDHYNALVHDDQKGMWGPTFAAKCHDNIIGPYTEESLSRFEQIGVNIFYKGCYCNRLGGNNSDNKFRDSCFNNTLGSFCSDNKFGDSCLNNTLGSFCFTNTVGDSCSDNTFGNYCSNNKFSISCSDNTFDIFCLNNTFGISCTNNTFNNSCTNNTFGISCTNNTFNNSCARNTFGDSCTNNTFNNSCSNNTLGDLCTHNTFNSSCSNNTLGDLCTGNTFNNSCSNNTLGDLCTGNTFGSSCLNSRLGDLCSRNTLGDLCNSNTFGPYCYNNTFGASCYNNKFGTLCSYNKLDTYCGKITFDPSCCNNTFGASCSKLNIKKDVSSVCVLQSTKVMTDNQIITIEFAPNKTYCQYAGYNSSGELKIWVPADLVLNS